MRISSISMLAGKRVLKRVTQASFLGVTACVVLLTASPVGALQRGAKDAISARSIDKGSEKLFEDANRGDLAAVKQDLANGADVNAKEEVEKYWQWSPLHIAVANGHADVAGLLLDHGANINAKNNLGQTPLQLAVDTRNAVMATLLLDHGADVNAKTNGGWTPLSAAVDRNDAKLAKLLLEYGAVVDESVLASTADAQMRTLLQSGTVLVARRQQEIREQAATEGAMRREGEPAFRNDVTTADIAVEAGQFREALQLYLRAFSGLPEDAPLGADQSLREKIIKVVLELNPRPAIPQDAIRHAAYAQAAIQDAGKNADTSDLSNAVSEIEKALRIAPWWAQAYFNLGEVLQKANRPGEAAEALQLYLLADPQATLAQKNGTNTQDVQMEIYKLQYEARKLNSQTIAGTGEPATQTITVPSGTNIAVRMIDSVDPKDAAGDQFHASLDQDLLVGGVILAARGSDIYGRLVEANSKLEIMLTTIRVHGQLVAIATSNYHVGNRVPTGTRLVFTLAEPLTVGIAVSVGH